MIIELRRAPTPDEMGVEEVCAVCERDFSTASVLAVAATPWRTLLGHPCPACVGYLGRRNPGKSPTVEEYEAAVRHHPEPVFATDDGPADLFDEDEGRFRRMLVGSRI